MQHLTLHVYKTAMATATYNKYENLGLHGCVNTVSSTERTTIHPVFTEIRYTKVTLTSTIISLRIKFQFAIRKGTNFHVNPTG